MIRPRDADLIVTFVWAEGGLRRFSGPAPRAGRQYRHGGFRAFGLRHVFHAERVVPVNLKPAVAILRLEENRANSEA